MKIRHLCIVGLLGIMMTSVKAEAQDTVNEKLSFLTAPYLQNPRPDAMTVMWVTSKNCHSWVEFGEKETLSEKADMKLYGLVQANNRINKIKLEQLKPNTRYFYKVLSRDIISFAPYKVVYGDTIQSRVYTFTTPAASPGEVSLLIMNDLHDRPASIPYLLGLNGNNPYDFVFFNGDILSYLNGESQIISSLIQPAAGAFASEKPFMYVRGNHETRGAYARNFYDYVDNDGSYYSFSRGPAYFIVLDTGEDKPDESVEYSGLVAFDDYREKQALWLEEQLKSEACMQAKFRVVLMHMPHYHSGDWHGVMHCRQLFGPLLNKYKVDISISGHTHQYGVYEPVKGEHDFPMIIGGGPKDGARTLIRLNIKEDALNVSILNDAGAEVGKYEIKK